MVFCGEKMKDIWQVEMLGIYTVVVRSESKDAAVSAICGVRGVEFNGFELYDWDAQIYRLVSVQGDAYTFRVRVIGQYQSELATALEHAEAVAASLEPPSFGNHAIWWKPERCEFNVVQEI